MRPLHTLPSHAGQNPASVLTLSAATHADRDFLLALYASTRQAERLLTAWPEDQWQALITMQFDIQQRQYHHNYTNAAFNIASLAQTPIGKIDIERRDGDIHIIDIALMPEHCNRGLGSQLIEYVLDEGRAQAKRVSLCVQKHHRALALYRRLGFEVCADHGVAWLMQYRFDHPAQHSGGIQQASISGAA